MDDTLNDGKHVMTKDTSESVTRSSSMAISKVTTTSLALGLITGIMMCCYWSDITDILGDFLVGIALFCWCSVRVIPQNPPI